MVAMNFSRTNFPIHYIMGNNNYPTNIDRYMALLNNYKSAKKKHTPNLVNQEEEAFFQDKDRHKYVTERKNNINNFK